MSATGYDVDNWRNLGKIASQLERIADSLQELTEELKRGRISPSVRDDLRAMWDGPPNTPEEG